MRFLVLLAVVAAVIANHENDSKEHDSKERIMHMRPSAEMRACASVLAPNKTEMAMAMNATVHCVATVPGVKAVIDSINATILRDAMHMVSLDSMPTPFHDTTHTTPLNTMNNTSHDSTMRTTFNDTMRTIPHDTMRAARGPNPIEMLLKTNHTQELEAVLKCISKETGHIITDAQGVESFDVNRLKSEILGKVTGTKEQTTTEQGLVACPIDSLKHYDLPSYMMCIYGYCSGKLPATNTTKVIG